MPKFQIGDRVRVVSDAGAIPGDRRLDYRLGDVGTVEDRSTAPDVRLDRTGEVVWPYQSDLELVVEPSDAHPQYFKPCPYDRVDVYRVLELFGVTSAPLQHAVKKLLVAGGRGHKDAAKDVREARDALDRWQAMRAEEAAS